MPGLQLVVPDDDRLEGEGALAEPGDHGLAAGLDALGDGDLALAREKLDRAHLAEIHADRVVGTVGGLLGGLGGDRGRLRLGELAGLGLLLGAALFRVLDLLGLDDVDAHVAEHGEDVLDMLRGHLLGGEDGVQLVIGDKAALLRGLDHLLDGGVGQVEERPVRCLDRGRRFRFFVFLDLGRHSPLSDTKRPAPHGVSPRRPASLIPNLTSVASRSRVFSRGPPPETSP